MIGRIILILSEIDNFFSFEENGQTLKLVNFIVKVVNFLVKTVQFLAKTDKLFVEITNAYV